MPLCWMQATLVRAAVDIIPPWIRERLGLTRHFGLRSAERWLIEAAGAIADRVPIVGQPVDAGVRAPGDTDDAALRLIVGRRQGVDGPAFRP